MKEYATLSVTVDCRGVASLQLDVEEKRNALSPKMIEELTDFATRGVRESSIRVIVLSGKGKVFCAGGDLAWMRAQIDLDRKTRMQEARKLAEMLRALNELPVPLIGKVQGNAFGGGVGMVCVCDMVIAACDTKFGLTETKLGLIPATIGPYVIARLGEGNARQIFMSGRAFDAEEACRLGVVSKVCTGDKIDELVESEIASYLRAAPGAVASAKAFARRVGSTIDDALINDSISRLADAWECEEAKEGIDAFFSKRKPSWWHH